MEQRWNARPKVTKKTPRKPADQGHRPARISRTKTRGRYRRESNTAHSGVGRVLYLRRQPQWHAGCSRCVLTLADKHILSSPAIVRCYSERQFSFHWVTLHSVSLFRSVCRLSVCNDAAVAPTTCVEQQSVKTNQVVARSRTLVIVYEKTSCLDVIENNRSCFCLPVDGRLSETRCPRKLSTSVFHTRVRLTSHACAKSCDGCTYVTSHATNQLYRLTHGVLTFSTTTSGPVFCSSLTLQSYCGCCCKLGAVETHWWEVVFSKNNRLLRSEKHARVCESVWCCVSQVAMEQQGRRQTTVRLAHAHKQYGSVHVLKDLCMTVQQGTMHTTVTIKTEQKRESQFVTTLERSQINTCFKSVNLLQGNHPMTPASLTEANLCEHLRRPYTSTSGPRLFRGSRIIISPVYAANNGEHIATKILSDLHSITTCRAGGSNHSIRPSPVQTVGVSWAEWWAAPGLLTTLSMQHTDPKTCSQPLYRLTLLASHKWRTGFNPRPGHSRIFTSGKHAGRCRWSAGCLGDLPPPPPRSGAAAFSPNFALIGSQDLVVNSHPYLSTLPTQTSANCSLLCSELGAFSMPRNANQAVGIRHSGIGKKSAGACVTEPAQLSSGAISESPGKPIYRLPVREYNAGPRKCESNVLHCAISLNTAQPRSGAIFSLRASTSALSSDLQLHILYPGALHEITELPSFHVACCDSVNTVVKIDDVVHYGRQFINSIYPPQGRGKINTGRFPPSRTGFNPRPDHSEFLQVVIVLDAATGWQVSRGSPISPAPFIPILTSLTLIGFQNFAVKSRPNLFTHSVAYYIRVWAVHGLTPYACYKGKSCKETCIAAKRDWAAMAWTLGP
ncbi:hypothetical protein PR048_014511 [Dryococelus australis]|uniref:Uncharacterized protein n=1 Tax=Dryococelus australis TaxID=614101 RepID=A0ABQ9HEM2_9NEOP|nr:hypothetical protein PR048_014511 [Dryococelus australis]